MTIGDLQWNFREKVYNVSNTVRQQRKKSQKVDSKEKETKIGCLKFCPTEK